MYEVVQFSSVAQLCLTLCDPMNCSMPGLPVHHQLPESTQTHVHRVGDAIQPSHPLSFPFPPALNLSQHQGLFQWVSSLHQVAKVLEFQLQHQSFQWTPRMDWLDLLAVQVTLKSLLQHHSSKASILRCSAFFTVQHSHPYMTTGKTIALTRLTFVDKVMSLLFNMLSRLVIRSKRLLISWLQSPSAVILEPRKIKSATVSPSICHEVMGPNAMILVFWMLSFKPTFSLSSFTFIKRLFSSSSLFAIRVVSSAYLRLLIFLPAQGSINSTSLYKWFYSPYPPYPSPSYKFVNPPLAHSNNDSLKSAPSLKGPEQRKESRYSLCSTMFDIKYDKDILTQHLTPGVFWYRCFNLVILMWEYWLNLKVSHETLAYSPSNNVNNVFILTTIPDEDRMMVVLFCIFWQSHFDAAL